MPPILEAFDRLSAIGFKVIPLRPNSKAPLCKGWPSNWNKDFSRYKLKTHPDCNIGFLLGDIIDVEGDTPEANAILSKLIGDYEHPVYSSTKSFHHLFINPDHKLRILKHKDIEFRGYGHQSVLPPSSHEGIIYKWVREPDQEIPVMPPNLLQLYQNLRRKRTNFLKPHHAVIRCATCGKKHFLHQSRLYLEIQTFQSFGLPWSCHSCRTVDLRPHCRKLKKSMHRQGLSIPHSL